MALTDKTKIVFDLSKELTMPLLLKEGYFRQHVIQAFEEMQTKGFGTFIKGSRGKGKCSKFLPNDKAPSFYELIVDADKLPKRRAPKPISDDEPHVAIKKSHDKIESKVSANDGPRSAADTACASLQQQALHSLWELSKNFVKDPTSSQIGYMCTIFANNILVLHRIRGGGVKSIKSAVEEVWTTIDSKIDLPKASKNEKLEQIVSALMGNGIFVMTHGGNNDD